MMVSALSRTPLVGYQLIVLALVATGFISFGVWAHHMFATGMPMLSVSLFSAASMAVSVPAGVQVFSWIATLASGKPGYNTPTLFVVGGLVTRSEEHTSELQSLMRISYAVFCLKKNTTQINTP